ncbi:hypothetical protein AVEN_36782-1 [Araneus ventricosus]|uniref:Uncharacterized protein n=1 Tax=Araneus ventricosus TaxID=182803 RepID=A0A4Y2KLJ2_ARAVE|nr:hypothetical protein AVEN_36782-1 [Araneus ventricosus]
MYTPERGARTAMSGEYKSPAAAAENRALKLAAIAPNASGSGDDPPFYGVTTRIQSWTQRVTPPLLYPHPGVRPRSHIRQHLILVLVDKRRLRMSWPQRAKPGSGTKYLHAVPLLVKTNTY